MHRSQPDAGVGFVVVAAATGLSFNANDDRFAKKIIMPAFEIWSEVERK